MRIEAPWWRTEPFRTRLRFLWRRVDDLAFGLTVAAIVVVVALVWWRSLDGGGLPFLPTSGPPLAAFGPENPYADVWPAGGAVATEVEGRRAGKRNAERDGSLTAGRNARRLEVVAGEDPTAPPFRSTSLGGSGGGTSGSGGSGSGSSQGGWQAPGPGGGTLPGDGGGGGGGGGGSNSPTPTSGPSPSPTTSPDPEPSQTPSPSPDPEPTSEPTSTASPCKSLPPNAQGNPCKGT